jgi:hypothetical protein
MSSSGSALRHDDIHTHSCLLYVLFDANCDLFVFLYKHSLSALLLQATHSCTVQGWENLPVSVYCICESVRGLRASINE